MKSSTENKILPLMAYFLISIGNSSVIIIYFLPRPWLSVTLSKIYHERYTYGTGNGNAFARRITVTICFATFWPSFIACNNKCFIAVPDNIIKHRSTVASLRTVKWPKKPLTYFQSCIFLSSEIVKPFFGFTRQIFLLHFVIKQQQNKCLSAYSLYLQKIQSKSIVVIVNAEFLFAKTYLFYWNTVVFNPLNFNLYCVVQ